MNSLVRCPSSGAGVHEVPSLAAAGAHTKGKPTGFAPVHLALAFQHARESDNAIAQVISLMLVMLLSPMAEKIDGLATRTK